MNTTYPRRSIFFTSGLLALLIASCGKPEPLRLALEGKVKYQHVPLEKGVIKFVPIDSTDGVSAFADVIDGTYSIPAKQGLLPGKYRVSISAWESGRRKPTPDAAPGGPTRSQEKLPAKYNKESELEAVVTGSGPNQFDYDLD
jgi:hypothetical protein